MAKFDIDKKGYDTSQVDKFIDSLTLKYEEKLSEQKDRVFSLKREIGTLKERLENYEQKDKQISKALIFAVEKAEQIENSAKKIYDLEVRRIRILYKKWNDILTLLEEFQPEILINGKLQLALNEFNGNIQSVIKQNEKFEENSVKNDIKKSSDNYIKNILNKMDYVINIKGEKAESESVKHEKKKTEDKKKSARIQNIQKRFQNLGLKNVMHSDSAEDYLNDDNKIETNNAYAKNLTRTKKKIEPNESGFDLDAILNPTEELDEIMKAFDFYEGSEEAK